MDKRMGRDYAWAADFAIPVGVAQALAPVKAQRDAIPATRGRVRMAYSEWLFTAPEGPYYSRWDNFRT